MTRVNVHIPDPDLAALSRLSVHRDLSVSELIRHAIAEYLRRQEVPAAPPQTRCASVRAEAQR